LCKNDVKIKDLALHLLFNMPPKTFP
jgi:hypothetical protein